LPLLILVLFENTELTHVNRYAQAQLSGGGS
jgi:hypothetical protein